jgi:uncharacterized membrane protein
MAGGSETSTTRLKTEAQNLASALLERTLDSLSQRLESATERLTDTTTPEPSQRRSLKEAAQKKAKDVVSGGVKDAARSAVKGAAERVSPGDGGDLKVTNIVEQIDVGVPRRVAYNQWTRFADFPSFMKKVEGVEQESDERLTWKAQVLWSHRTWESTITEQVPDQRIIWRSKGSKGHVDGAVTFHELAPDLTRILLVLEYHPQGFLEGTGNLVRAQGRRARLELKHFYRHVMTQALLHPEDVTGWRGEIRDGEVIRTHEEALEEEEQAAESPEEHEQEGEENGEPNQGGEADQDVSETEASEEVDAEERESPDEEEVPLGGPPSRRRPRRPPRPKRAPRDVRR